MSYNPAHWSINRTTGDVRYIGDDHGGASPSYATVIEAHRAWQDFADNLTSSGDDELDMTDTNPSARSTDNIIQLLGIYNIDNVSSEHLYDGSIIQNNGDDIWDGIINYGNPDVQLQIHQDAAVIADDWWNFGGFGLNADNAQGISHNFMLPVRVGGVDIDGRRLLGTNRRFNKTYGEFPINGTKRGTNVLALADADDLNNETAGGTVAGWSGISNTTEGYIGLDVNNNGADEFYYSQWDANTPTRTINEFYEKMKYITRDGSVDTMYGISGELFRGITHEIDVDTPAGTFNSFEEVNWGAGATAGKGQMLAINSPTAATKMWIQLLSGVIPTDGLTITGATSGGTVVMNATILLRTLSTPFVGQSTGTAIIGAYGLGIELNDLLKTDKVFDLGANPVTPPNNVTFSVNGLEIGEDTVQVAPWDGASTDVNGKPEFEKTQFALNGDLTTDNITAVPVTPVIPSDTPSTGHIRVTDNDGFTRRLHYSSWTGSVFTIDSTDGQEDFATVNATGAKNTWITYLDKIAAAATESFTFVYAGSDRDFVVLVRDGGSVNATPIKEFIQAGSMGENGGSISAILTTDL